MKEWFRKQLRRKARIYIFPTRMGGYLNGLIFLMFLLSIGYSNNLLLIFTLFLFGFNLIWVIQTHFHLHALKFGNIQVASGHADDLLSVVVHWKKVPAGPMNWELTLVNRDRTPVPMLQHDSEKSQGHLHIKKRGLYEWSHLLVKTEMPFGLYTAWVYFPVESRAYVYPAKLKNVPDIQSSHSTQEGDHHSSRKGFHDISNLGPYQGEESKRISWKHYARSGDLLVKEGEELVQKEVEFRLQFDETNKEYALSKLATQMVHCAKNETPFSFVSATRKFKAGTSEKHLHDCLKELALC